MVIVKPKPLSNPNQDLLALGPFRSDVKPCPQFIASDSLFRFGQVLGAMPTGLSAKTPWFSWMGGPHLKETPQLGIWDSVARYRGKVGVGVSFSVEV